MLSKQGIPKLGEETGELVAAICKQIAYWGHRTHPVDGYDLVEKIEEEAGDVWGALFYAIKHFGLDEEKIRKRAKEKFTKWDAP